MTAYMRVNDEVLTIRYAIATDFQWKLEEQLSKYFGEDVKICSDYENFQRIYKVKFRDGRVLHIRECKRNGELK